MKTLYLARHAKSSWDDPGQSDFDRPLNARGQHDAPRMAHYLLEHHVRPDRILTSPAMRARTTATIYHETLGGILKEDDRIYEASVTSLLYLAQEALESAETLMLVGHNPGLTELANLLGDAPIYNLQTSGVVGLQFEGEIQPGNGHRFLYLYPKKIAEAKLGSGDA